MRQRRAAGFDLARELPLRAHLYALEMPGRSEHVLLLVLHHIAGDGWSLRPLLRDLGRSTGRGCEGDAAALPALPVQYADYTLWQQRGAGRRGRSRSAIARQLAYWKEALRSFRSRSSFRPTGRVLRCRATAAGMWR